MLCKEEACLETQQTAVLARRLDTICNVAIAVGDCLIINRPFVSSHGRLAACGAHGQHCAHDRFPTCRGHGVLRAVCISIPHGNIYELPQRRCHAVCQGIQTAEWRRAVLIALRRALFAGHRMSVAGDDGAGAAPRRCVEDGCKAAAGRLDLPRQITVSEDLQRLRRKAGEGIARGIGRRITHQVRCRRVRRL